MENSPSSGAGSGDTEDQTNCGIKDFGLDYGASDSCIALSKSHRKDNKFEDALQNGACLKSPKKCIQPDGKKFGNATLLEKYGDMSCNSTRNETFRKFPLRVLVDRIRDSGYFYTGEGDRTVCHRCHAEVGEWTEKDNPANFHEPDCEYHRIEEPFTKYPQQSFEGTPAPHLPNRPTAESSRNISSVLVPKPASSRNIPSSGAKQFVAKNSSLAVEISEVADKAFEDLLGNLNLCSEEDRRKTFLFKDAWKENTNNVVKPTVLAANGFFYLGNLDRTRCFSCVKVLKTWRHGDKVSKVHRVNVPECRMVQGKEARNIPILKSQRPTDSLSPASGLQPNLESLSPPAPVVAAPLLLANARNPSESSHRISETLSLRPLQPNVFRNTPNLVRFAERSLPVCSTSASENSTNLALEPPHPGFLKVQGNVPYQESNIQRARVPQKIKIGDHVPLLAPEHNNNRQEAPSNPTSQSSANQPALSPPTLSWHLGQTTIYNTPTAQAEPRDELSNLPTGVPDVPVTLLPSAVACPTVAVPNVPAAGGMWAEAFPCDEPDNPQMRSTIARQETFDFNWTQSGINDTADIARAGFYATGNGTFAKCWYCGHSLNQWNIDEDVWEQHAILCPNCEFLLQQKGPDFVAEVSSRRPPPPPVPRYSPPSVPSDDDESPMSSMELPGRPFPFAPFLFPFGLRRQSSPPRVVDPRQEEENRKRLLQTTLDSELAFQAAEMGFEMPVIRRTIKKKIRETDTAFSNADAFLEALLNPPDESSSSSSEDEEPAPSNAPGTSTAELATIAAARQGGAEAAPSPEGAESLDPKQMDEKLREYEQEKRCKVCLDRDAEVVFVPCGHLCTCTECAGVLRSCPLCRKRIQKSMKIYTS